MKVLVNRKPVDGPWGGGNLLITALCNILVNNGHRVVHQFEEEIDVIFMQDPRYSDLGISINEIVNYKTHNPTTKIVHRVNECDARKNTADVDDLLRLCSQYTDHTIFVSEWMRQYHVRQNWQCYDTSVIYNGVDKKHFYAVPSNANSEKVNIVTHHWSNNRMKGFDVYEALDQFVHENSNFTFTYIGRELGTFKNTKIIPPIHGADLGKELSKYDVYVSGSLFDPGPNHILESIACGIPTYVIKDGGGAVEFAGLDHVYKTIDGLIEILKSKDYHKNNFQVQSWESCIEKYVNLFSSLEY